MKTNYILIASAASALLAATVASADTAVQKGAQVTQYNNVSSVNNQSNGTTTTVNGNPAAAQQALQSASMALRQATGGSNSGPVSAGMIVRPGATGTSPTSAGTNHVINWHSTNPSAGGSSNGGSPGSANVGANFGSAVNGNALAQSVQVQVGKMLSTNPAYRQAIGYPLAPSGIGSASGAVAPQTGTTAQRPATVNSSNVSSQVTCSPSCTTTTSSGPNGTSTMIVSNVSNSSSVSSGGNAQAPSASAIQSQINAAQAQAFQSFGGWHQ